MSQTIACIDLSWMFSLKDYWYAIVSAVIGALIGIWWANRQFKTQKEKIRIGNLTRLKACLDFNLERLQQAKVQLVRNEVPNYPFDTAQLNHWLAASHDSLSQELLRSLDWQRFQLEHITSKFVVLNNAIVATAGESLNPEQREHRLAIIRSLNEHVERVLTEIKPLVDQIPKS